MEDIAEASNSIEDLFGTVATMNINGPGLLPYASENAARNITLDGVVSDAIKAAQRKSSASLWIFTEVLGISHAFISTSLSDSFTGRGLIRLEKNKTRYEGRLGCRSARSFRVGRGQNSVNAGHMYEVGLYWDTERWRLHNPPAHNTRSADDITSRLTSRLTPTKPGQSSPYEEFHLLCTELKSKDHPELHLVLAGYHGLNNEQSNDDKKERIRRMLERMAQYVDEQQEVNEPALILLGGDFNLNNKSKKEEDRVEAVLAESEILKQLKAKGVEV